MDEQDLFEALTDKRARSLAGRQYLTKLAAGPVDLVSHLPKFITNNPMATGAAIGAVALTTAQWMANRRGKKGTPSAQENLTESVLHSSNREMESLRKAKETPSFYQKMRRITAKPLHELSGLAADHPVQAALPMLPLGAGLGAGLIRAFRR